MTQQCIFFPPPLQSKQILRHAGFLSPTCRNEIRGNYAPVFPLWKSCERFASLLWTWVCFFLKNYLNLNSHHGFKGACDGDFGAQYGKLHRRDLFCVDQIALLIDRIEKQVGKRKKEKGKRKSESSTTNWYPVLFIFQLACLHHQPTIHVR